MTESVTPQPSARLQAYQAEEISIEPRSYYGEAFRKLIRSPSAVISMGLLVVLIFGAIAAPLITAHDPLEGNIADRLQSVGSPEYILGTDEQGRDMLTRLLFGGRLSLLVGILPVLIATLLGTAVGAIAGYLRGTIGTVLMRIMDMSYAFPAVLLAIGITAALGPGVKNSIIAISVVFVPPISRVAEAATRQVVVQEYVEAAKISGASLYQMIVSQLLPNIMGPIFVYSAGLFGVSIVLGSGLSFLGLGSAPPTPEWGYMLSSLRGSLYVQPVVVALPGLFIFVTSIAFNVFSDDLHDALDLKGM